jgi:hypothetical protein
MALKAHRHTGSGLTSRRSVEGLTTEGTRAAAFEGAKVVL